MRRLVCLSLLLAGGLPAQLVSPIPIPVPGGTPVIPGTPGSGGSSGGTGSANSTVIRTNGGFLQKSVARNDDGSAPPEDLGFTINFFGKQRPTVYVNNNGNVTFDSPLSTYTPFGLVGTAREIIAPFFADVDTRNPQSKLVTYGRDSVDGHLAFGVNYIDVGYYNAHADKLASFQVIVIDRSDLGAGDFDVEFNYARIPWETGDASGGTGGLGGVPASVGWSNGSGDPGTYFELEGSLIAGSFLDNGRHPLIQEKIDSPLRGRLRFHARAGVLLPPLSITTACPLPGAPIGQPYNFQFTGVGGNQPYQWTLVPDPGTVLTPGLTLANDGKLSGTPTAGGTSSFTVRLTATTDAGQETVSSVCSLNVIAPLLSIVTSCPLPQATVGTAYSQVMTAAGGRPPFTWSVDAGSVPSGLTLTSDGLLAGTPTAPGTFAFQLMTASNPADGAQPATRGCSLTVRALPVDLTANGALPPGTVGVPYSRDLTVQGGTPPYRWMAVGALPPGFSVSPEGRVSGTVSTSGSYTFHVRAIDSAGNQSTVTVGVVIADPVIRVTDACPLPSGTSGTAYTHQMNAAGGTPPYTWSLLSSLQPGLTLSPEGLLSGTAQGGGSVGFRVLVTDSAGNSVARGCTLPVVRSGFGLGGCPLPAATAGTSYSRTISALGGTPPYVFVSGGSLPDGISLSSYGRVSGTPIHAGVYPLSVQVTDANGHTTTQPCTLPVNASQLIIQSGCPLPEARVGISYVSSLVATGGMPPYSYAAISGMPAGLTVNPDGSITGMPTTSGNSLAILSVTDSQHRVTIETCAASVHLPELPPIQFADIPATVAAASAGPTMTLTLGNTYSLPIAGQLNLTVTPDTGASDGRVNRPDPRVRFANGQLSAPFTIPAGATTYSMAVSSTGTVASSVVTTVSNVKAGSSAVPAVPATKGFRIPRGVPVITSGCYSSGSDTVNAVITGYTTTRQLNTANFTFGTGNGDQQKSVDISSSASDYFSTDDSVRNGGAFTLTIPFTLQNTSVSNLSVTLSNSEGSSASASLNLCQ